MKKNIIYHETILIVITFFILFIVKVPFANGDEYAIAYSMAGGFGSGIPRLIYATIGPLFGLIESVLSVVFFDKVYIITIVLLCMLISNNIYLALRYFEVEWYGFLFNYMVYAYMLISYSYSMLTILLSGSAFLLAYAVKYAEKTNYRVELVMMLVSVLFAGSLRYSLCFFSLFCVLFFVVPDSKKRNLKLFCSLAVAMILVIGVNYLSRSAICRFFADCNDYLEWYNASVGFRDFPDVEYDDYSDLFASVGWSRNDVNMLNHWCFDDLEVFSTENMQKVLSGIPFNQHYNLDFKRILKDLLAIDIVWVSLALFFISVICTITKDKKIRISRIAGVLAVFIPFGGIMVALGVRQRVYAHIYMPFFILILLELVILIRKENRLRAFLGICIIALMGLWGTSELKTIETDSQNSSDIYGDYVQDHSDMTFFVDNSVLKYFKESSTPIIDKSRYELLSKLVTMADFDTASPRDFIKHRNAGLTEESAVYTNLLHEGVLYFGKEDGAQLEYLKTYFIEHYGNDVEVEIVYDFKQDSNVKVYKFSKN